MNNEQIDVVISAEAYRRKDGLWCAKIVTASRCGKYSDTMDAGPFETEEQARRAIREAKPLVEKAMQEAAAAGHIGGYTLRLETGE